MDQVKKFLSYVEIKTKITSVFPFLMMMAYLPASGYGIDALRSAVFFCGMIMFDLTATTINNYFDTMKNSRTLQFERRTAGAITIVLLAASAAFGVWLVILTDIVVLLLGGLCFLFGIGYSFGPVPVSHGPYGEFISGFFYGIVIPAIIMYINVPGELLRFSVSPQYLSGTVYIAPAIRLLLVSAVPFCLTANIMLANNICDKKSDVEVGRYTLPYYLGEFSLYLFAILYYTAYISVLVMVALNLLSPVSLFLTLTIVPVQKNISLFFKKQDKEETFPLAIKNFIIIYAAHCFLIFSGRYLSDRMW